MNNPAAATMAIHRRVVIRGNRVAGVSRARSVRFFNSMMWTSASETT